jgi:hypothetical protein
VQKVVPLTVMVTVPDVTAVDPALTRAGLTLPAQPVSTVEGSDRLVVVGIEHAAIKVTGFVTENPLDTSVTRTVPPAVAPQGRLESAGSTVVKIPPPITWQTGFSRLQISVESLATT